jgi:hypothetical protein
MFLKTLESMPRPPSLASAAQSRAYLPSTSSSLSNPRHSVLATGLNSGGSPGDSGPSSGADSMVTGGGSAFMRKRMTKAEVDAALNRMAGSYTLAAQPFAQPGTAPLTGSALATSSSVSPVDRLTPSALRTPSINRHNAPLIGDRIDQPIASSEPVNRSASHTASTRDVGFAARMGSSVKSSSPLAQAPIQASPMDPPATGQASVYDQSHSGDQVSDRAQIQDTMRGLGRTDPRPESFDLPDEQSRRHTSERMLPKVDRHVQSLPGNSHGISLTRNHSLPPPLPSTSASGDAASLPIPIQGERDSKRRAPVLQRGGFNQLMSLSRDNTSGPATGISSVSVGGSADLHPGSALPAKKVSRSVPVRDLLANPRTGAQQLPSQTASISDSLRVGPAADTAFPERTACRDDQPENVSRPSLRDPRASIGTPHLIRALSGGSVIERVVGNDVREQASPERSDIRHTRPAVGSSYNLVYRTSGATKQQSCATAPASFDERKGPVDHIRPDRRWASEEDQVRSNALPGGGYAHDDNEESVVGDLEMGDCNR